MSKYVDLDQIEFLKVDGNKEFNHGVDCCINTLLKAEPIEVISLEKVKEARKEMAKLSTPPQYHDEDYYICGVDDVLEILDKLIESED